MTSRPFHAESYVVAKNSGRLQVSWSLILSSAIVRQCFRRTSLLDPSAKPDIWLWYVARDNLRHSASHSGTLTADLIGIWFINCALNFVDLESWNFCLSSWATPKHESYASSSSWNRRDISPLLFPAARDATQPITWPSLKRLPAQQPRTSLTNHTSQSKWNKFILHVRSSRR
jgi:hypothetical protein